MSTARVWLLLLGSAVAPATLPAQFDFGRLKKGLDTVTEKATDVAKVARGATADFSIEQEQYIGDAVALEIVGRYGGLWRDEAATRRVNLIGGTLARYCDRPGLEWRFAVLNSPGVNAFSAPGGWVFLTRGLYELAASDDWLAGILAHEISHITAKHALKIIGRQEALAIVGRETMKRSSDLQAADASLDQARAKAAQLGPEVARFLDVNVAKIVTLLLEKGFDPKTEYAADKGGRSLAVLTGFAPGGLRAVLLELERRKVDPKTAFSTHPPVKSRLKELPADPAPPRTPPTATAAP